MSTLTKEWLQQTIAELEEERDETPGAVNEDAANALAAMKIALASLEAKPVAYMYKDNLHSDARFSLHTRFGNWSQEDINEYEITEIPLYAAPPAPVLVTDIKWPEEKFCPAEYAGSQLWEETEIWNKAIDACKAACRAAMLQGAELVSNRDELPDGWVACSERMPEDEQEVITHNIFGYRHVSFFDEHSGNFFNRLDGSPVDCVEHVLVSHWMPLPAAPQQEVK
ncbi:TPA: DUF551 domain-containing protein [Enterobacter hormaechei]